MKVVASILILTLACAMVSGCENASEEQLFSQFQTFMTEHKKTYSTVEEFKERFEIFKQNYKKKLNCTNNMPLKLLNYSNWVSINFST